MSRLCFDLSGPDPPKHLRAMNIRNQLLKSNHLILSTGKWIFNKFRMLRINSHGAFFENRLFIFFYSARICIMANYTGRRTRLHMLLTFYACAASAVQETNLKNKGDKLAVYNARKSIKHSRSFNFAARSFRGPYKCPNSKRLRSEIAENLYCWTERPSCED